MQKIDGKLFNFMLPDELRARLERQAKQLNLTMAEVIRNDLDVALEVYDIFNKLGLFTIYQKHLDMREYLREQLLAI
jgi:hypothetical protein